MTPRTNLQALRRQLDIQGIPTYHENPDSRNLPVLVVVNRDGSKIYVVVGKETFGVGEEKFSVETTTEHKTVADTLEAILKLRHSRG